MKRIIVITGLVLSGLFISCNNFEDGLEAQSESALDESIVFSSYDLAEKAIYGIKIPMGETNSYRGRYLPWYGLNTDSEWYNSSESIGDKSDLVAYDAKPNNSEMNTDNNVWAQMYSGIERANLCIRGLRTYGNPAPDTDMGYLLGEALTLRAVYYADLLKTWGDVPARFEPVTNETTYVAKTSRDVIYKQLIDDLEEAATLVPWPNGNTPTATTERVNKAFVKGLRARLALAASGYQQYPDGVRRSNDPELSVQNMYSLALAECRDVILSGSAHLEPTFEGLWKKYNQENISAGGESLWEIPFGSGRGRMLFTFAVNHAGNDQFHQNGSNRGGVAGPLPHVFYDYDMADLRRDVTVVPYRWGAAVNGIAKQVPGALNRWYFGKYRYEWMTRIVTSTNDDGVNKIYMRYAEILMMAAEAANEIEGPASAAPYLKEIRRRAFPAAQHGVKVDAYVNALSSKPAMHQAIMNEHKFEFTGEMERKLALIRWNKLGENLAEAKAKMSRLQQRTGEYADVASTIYYKLNPDNVTITIYGLNHGELSNPGAGWTSVAWSNLTDAKIAGLYRPGVNPDQRQFWPIWQIFLDTSNGKIINDYGY
ncbi:MAG: RagB/SusD family nutrient uptake outer membrane protein [Flavobacterium sp.]